MSNHKKLVLVAEKNLIGKRALPGRVFVARNRLDLAMIDSIVDQTEGDFFDIIVTVFEGQYPEIDSTFTEEIIANYLVQTFDLVLNLNEVIYPTHPLVFSGTDKENILKKLFSLSVPERKIEYLIIPDLEKTYILALCDTFPKAKFSVYISQLSVFSLDASKGMVNNSHRLKDIYGPENFEVYFPLNKVKFKPLPHTTFRNSILKINKNILLPATKYLAVNANRDICSDGFSRKNEMLECKELLSIVASIEPDTGVVLRVPQSFDEADFLELAKWYHQEFQKNLLLVSHPEDFLSLLLLMKDALVVGFCSFELLVIRELTTFSVLAVQQKEQLSSGEARVSAFSDRVVKLIVDEICLIDCLELKNTTLSDLNVLSIKQRRLWFDDNVRNDLRGRIEALLFFSDPKMYGYLAEKTISVLEMCSNNTFTAMFPEEYLVQDHIAAIVHAWSKVCVIESNFRKTLCEYRKGSILIAELACRYHLGGKESPSRRALLAKILFDSGKFKSALTMLFTTKEKYPFKKLFFVRVYALWKFVNYLFRRRAKS